MSNINKEDIDVIFMNPCPNEIGDNIVDSIYKIFLKSESNPEIVIWHRGNLTHIKENEAIRRCKE